VITFVLPAIGKQRRRTGPAQSPNPNQTVRLEATVGCIANTFQKSKGTDSNEHMSRAFVFLIRGFEVAPTAIFAFYGAFVFNAETFG